MDNPPRELRNDIQKHIQEKHTNDNIDHGDILQPSGVRGVIRPGRIMDWVISNNRWHFLCHLNLFVYPLLFIIKKMGF